jgi:rhodanese-related sulfurtransferase
MSEPQPEAKAVLKAKEKLTQPISTPPELTGVSSAQALKERLNWGEPALTILDVRSRESYLEERIKGAMPFSDAKDSLALSRDIYIYGDSNEAAAEAANQLRQAGFENVSQLQGGLAGWKAVQGATEGRSA